MHEKRHERSDIPDIVVHKRNVRTRRPSWWLAKRVRDNPSPNRYIIINSL